MTGRVLVLGSLNVDLVTRVDRHPLPGETRHGTGLRRLAGGKGANQAVAAAAAGAEVALVGCVGDDDAGAAYLARLRRLGVDVTGVRVVAAEVTGHALVTVGADGENTIVVVAGANGSVGAQELSALETLRPQDVLLLQLEIPVPTVCAAARHGQARGARVVINCAPYAALPPDVLALADPVVANEHERAALSESGASCPSLLVTLGPEGAHWGDEWMAAVAVPPNKLRDTTGAGDAFCGALAAALAAGADQHTALRAALDAGGEAVRRDGAQSDPEL